MKKYRYTTRLTGILAILFLITACEPQLADKPDIGTAPTADQLDFTITPGKDEFHFVIANTSSVTGIPSWNFGNSTKGTGMTNEVKYPLPGDYTVTMTLVTRGGIATKTKVLTQTETDFSIFTDPVYVNLTGGAADADGKTWVLDAETKGHLGVGDANGLGNGLEWWAANPFDKSGTGAYDDELTFVMTDFVVKYDNKGVSYVKGYIKDDPALASVYTNPRQNKDDWDVDYVTPTTGTWSILQKNGDYYVSISSTRPIHPGLDVGAKNNEYRIVQVSENLLELTCYSAYENWTMWHYFMVPKGYQRPKITFAVNAVEGTDNSVACSVANYVIPAGQSVTNIVWNFGDGSTEVTGGKDEVVNHVFMRKGVYTVTAKLNTSIGILTGTKSVTLANNNSAYVPFLLDAMIVYNDFSEVQVFPVLAENCSLTTVDNPEKEYPNRSARVALYSRTDNQYANAFIKLPAGFRFDLRLQQTFKVMVRGKTGDVILLKLENSDPAEPWRTGTEKTYTILTNDSWEIAEFNFNGVPAGFTWTGDLYAPDVVADDRFNHDYYNVVRLMCNPTVATGTHSFYFDELSGPHVEGIHK
ncbi:MAG: PKD domain-containing protein [Bacteroidales bacterium]